MKMARSPHAFVRGSTAQFYDWLDARGGHAPQGPHVWICGDCHTGNLGPVADAKGRVAVQIRDLDQTVIGNPAHDLIRLGLSLAMAARGSNLPGVTVALMAEQLVGGYADGLSRPHPGRGDETAPKAVRQVLRQSLRRRWKDLARERIDDPKPVIPLGKRFWALSERERRAIGVLAESESLRRLVTLLQGRPDGADVELADAAYWMKGCSSLGRLRFAVLVKVRSGDTSETCLIDVKEAVEAAAPHAPGARMPRSQAARVVKGARALSPNLGDRMLAARLLNRAVVLRELTPQDLKLNIERLSRAEAVRAARYLAAVVGRAHARQMDRATRQAWARDLARGHSKALEAPSWLWNSLVELVGAHESAYLDYCRSYALQAQDG
ncbi:DUF2252 family protein [Phenylobacterium sp.]|jgi:uncharacterized protein (DUF2252 family)|uniref:DUF2252 family protein n=1 Tax=Phenylobacterium sp. TaxID=1871053 RepID=UPI002F4173DD